MMLFEKILVDANDNHPIAIFGTFDIMVEPQHTHTYTYTKFLGQLKNAITPLDVNRIAWVLPHHRGNH